MNKNLSTETGEINYSSNTKKLDKQKGTSGKWSRNEK